MTDLILTPRQTRLLRARAQGLLPQGTEPGSRPARLLARVCGVQAQELPAALLSIRARSSGLTLQAVEQARQSERAIARTWLMRGTLHLVAAEDLGWLLDLLAPRTIAAGRRRLKELGWDEARLEAGLRLLEAELRRRAGENPPGAPAPGLPAPLTRPELARLLQEQGLPFEGQAPYHLLYRGALEGLLCFGPDQEGEPGYVLRSSWTGTSPPLERREALARLACRYLAGYGPAGLEDLASWSGLGQAEAREAWELSADWTAPVQAAGRPARLLKEQLSWLEELPAETAAPSVRLLPRYDTYLLGYAGRELAVEPAYTRRVHPGGGIIHQTLLVDGQVLGVWKTRRRSRGGRPLLEITVEPFDSLPETVLPGLEAEAADLGRFLGEEAVWVPG